MLFGERKEVAYFLYRLRPTISLCVNRKLKTLGGPDPA